MNEVNVAWSNKFSEKKEIKDYQGSMETDFLTE